MKNLSKKLIIVIVFFVLLAIAFSSVEMNGEKPKQLSLNALAQKIGTGEVKSIEVSGNDVNVVLNSGDKVLAQKEAESGLVETLKNYGVDPKQLQSIDVSVKGPGGTQYWLEILIPTLLPLIVIAIIFFWLFRQAKTGANQAFSFGKINARLFAVSRDRILFKDIAGLKEAKEELREVVDFLKNPKKFLDIGAKIPRGVLLIGYPGTGKTLLARAVAGESNVPFLHISASEFVEMFVGVGASRVRDLFQTAKRAAPAIIFIDEIDAVGRERGTGLGGGHDEREQTLNQILVEMDGFDRDTNVIVIAATNRPDVLDAALLRPGRFDRRVMLDMPDIQDRKAVLEIHSEGKPLDKDVDLRTIAVRTPGFSGADLANLMNEAAILAARRNKKIVSQAEIIHSIEKVMLGPERRSRVISEREKKITAYHEAGHALVSAALKDADPVHKISIVSRGFAGGYTLKLPTEERRLKTRAQFLAELAVAFGGYASELQEFKDITTGSSSDIQQATDIAHDLVARYGMSEKLGPRAFGKHSDLVFLGREISSARDYSESVGTKIDEEISAVIQKTLGMAKKIVLGNKEILDAIAKELIEKETIEHEEFNKLIKNFNLKPIAIK